MTKDLVVRLTEEVNDEAEHKSRCDTELLMNGQNRKEKTEAVESLHAEADHSEAFASKLTEEIGELKKVVAELISATTEAHIKEIQINGGNTTTKVDLYNSYVPLVDCYGGWSSTYVRTLR